MKGILDTKLRSSYDDDIVQRYHFPKIYLETVREFIDDWVIYRETRRNGGRMAYVAVARVIGIEPDPELADHWYAYVDDYTPFEVAVPLQYAGSFMEQPLQELADSSKVGAALQGKSARRISEVDFYNICSVAFPDLINLSGAFPAASSAEFQRAVKTIILRRKIRSARFRLDVLRAYDHRCSFTGLSIVDADGLSEVQAAHVLAVSSGGPDTIPNGIAMSATCHWLFDHHVVSIDHDYRLLMSAQGTPAALGQLLASALSRIALPADPALWPDRNFLAKHRAIFRKKEIRRYASTSNY